MISETKREVLRLFSEGRKLYKKRDFQAALRQFEQAVALDPSDGPSEVFRTRCELYIKTPPPEGWDGVWTMTTK